VKYNFDLSPNLSPKRREALNFPPSRNGLWVRGLGLFVYLYLTRLKMAILIRHLVKLNQFAIRNSQFAITFCNGDLTPTQNVLPIEAGELNPETLLKRGKNKPFLEPIYKVNI
jgi:hypothetical protein